MANLVEMKPKIYLDPAMQRRTVKHRASEPDIVHVTTSIPSDLADFWAMYKENPSEVTVVSDNECETEFIIPAEWVTLASANETYPAFGDEQEA